MLKAMRCPHCFVTFDDQWRHQAVCTDSEATFKIAYVKCSACGRAIIVLTGQDSTTDEVGEWMMWPRGSIRPVAPEVPKRYAEDFRQACMILQDSTNASAALSRRCLQSLLVNEGSAKKRNLVDQIDEVIQSKQLRTQLAENLHYIRKVGNLGAHETKNTHTGEVVDATAEEAEWLIEVLEGLFEHFFVEPEREKQRRAKFDERVKSTGKQLAGKDVPVE